MVIKLEQYVPDSLDILEGKDEEGLGDNSMLMTRAGQCPGWAGMRAWSSERVWGRVPFGGDRHRGMGEVVGSG